MANVAAVHRGVTAARSRAYAAAGSLAFAPIIEWLRSDLYRSALGNLAHAQRTELMRLLPELSTQWPDLPQPAPMPGAAQRRQLLDALAASVLLPADPLLLVLDDLQSVSYTHLRAHETVLDLVCRLLLEKKKTTHSTKPTLSYRTTTIHT